MIVVDASAALEILLRTPAGETLEKRLLESGASLHAPHLIDVEVAQVLRGFALRGGISPARGEQALHDFAAFSIHRYPHDFLLPRVWELRHNLSAYDAIYVALAEVIAAPLITHDRRLANAAGIRAQVEVV